MYQASLFSDTFSGAILVGEYRYSLWRIWDLALPRALFIMLNPSTADTIQNDPTLRRCVGFARAWACGSVEVVNLFALRSTNPAMLAQVADPVGPDNTKHIQQAIERASIIVCAWGAHKQVGYRDIEVLQLLEGKEEVYSLGYTKEGLPRHPLYVPATSPLIRYP